MPSAEATIETERPGRYLVQLCKHAAAMGSGAHRHGPRVHLRDMLDRQDVRVNAEWSDTRGTVTFDPWGRCTLEAGPNTLTVRVDAGDDEALRRIQDILTRDFDRFGRRDKLTLNWRQSTGPAS